MSEQTDDIEFEEEDEMEDAEPDPNSLDSLTKKEFFAIMAMQGLLSNPNIGAYAVVTEAMKYANKLMDRLAREED